MSAVDRSTIWSYRAGEPTAYYYSRFANPTTVAAERELGELEGADGERTLLFPSGAGACTVALLALLEPGQAVALAEGGYFGTDLLLGDLERWGIRRVPFDQTGPPPDGVDLVWLEAPSNPFLTMPDLAAAAAHPARVLVDATAATPVYLRPLEHGADVVLHSATKYLTGHHDALLGALVFADRELAARVRGFRGRSGIVAAPDAAWLLSRGLKTLRVRIERQTETARALARRLAAHPAVRVVRYPGFGGLLSFDVADADAARAIETRLHVVTNATSLGGVTSTLESRHRWEGDRVPPGLLRLSVGLEPVDELWADLEQALGWSHACGC